MFDPVSIIKAAGLLGIFLIIFTESGLFFGFFLPGDTLLFAAGIFASQGYFPLGLLIVGCALSAIAGDSVGYWTGKKMGRKLFDRDASFFFNKKKIQDAEYFYKKYGAITILIARFIPIVRTFAPIVAGVAHMRYKRFFAYNIIGAIAWAGLVPVVGYYFGTLIPNPDRFILPIVSAVIAFSFVPLIVKFFHTLFKKITR